MPKTALVLTAGFALRMVCFTLFPGLSEVLGGRVECSTPITAYKRLLEGLHHYKSGQSPYDDGVFHQSPLLLALYSLVPESHFATSLAFTLVDLVAAIQISKAAGALTRRSNQLSYGPHVLAAIFLFNPYTLLSTLARSTATVSNALVVAAVSTALNGRGMLSMALLALAANLAFYPVFLAPSVILIAREWAPCTLAVEHKQSNAEKSTPKSEEDLFLPPTVPESAMPLLWPFVRKHAFYFVASCALFFGLQWQTMLSLDFVDAFYGTMLLFRDLRPNIGLWWYFFVEMFDFFRPFFVGVFQLFLASFCLPVTLRLRQIPLAALATVSCTTLLFRPYPEIGDLGLHLTLLALCRPVLKRKY